MKTDEIRKRYLSFFERKGHTILPSDSLVPEDDPTLLFTGAGMNQFKDMFLGKGTLNIKRATTCQKCLRTGDIENVGRTPRHHTFFEMMGNFSFGEYFKTEAIELAWEFMLQEMKLQEEKLVVSVFIDDDESYQIWSKKIGVPKEKIYRFDEKDNFWPASAPSQGPNGPCGPCSEIYYDRGQKIGCGRKECAPDCDCERFVEIWNLVFTQFDRKETGILEPLPNKNVDTGMGLERMASVMQGAATNFEIDIFLPIIQNISELVEIPYDGEAESGKMMNRIADHIRAIIFCIADGVLPSNEGRGYIERRLLRRAVRDGLNLGKEGSFLYKLVPIVAEVMQAQYPDIKNRRENIARIIKNEEERFRETLYLGNKRLGEFMDTLRENRQKVLTGPEAFLLYDTYGFPFEMTESILRENSLEIDKSGFEREMNLQRQRAKESSNMKGNIFDEGPLDKIKENTSETIFLGYNNSEAKGEVRGLIVDKQLVCSVEIGQDTHVVLDQTPFYGESGGQLGDTGTIQATNGEIEVKNTQVINNLIVHMGTVVKGKIGTHDKVVSKIDKGRRAAIQRNHTATHLLHHILRKVIGQHAEQSGSLVAAHRLRFDFHHFAGVKKDELTRIEELMNEKIMENSQVAIQEMSINDAKTVGAVALFGEKYGESVRVVDIGGFSRELCGGTHVVSTGEIGLFKIIHESSVAAGIRRIEAVTGQFAMARTKQKEEILGRLCRILDTPENSVIERAEELIQQVKEFKKESQKTKKESAQENISNIIAHAKKIEGVSIVTEMVEGVDKEGLRRVVDVLKKNLHSVAIVLGAVDEGRVTLVTAFSNDLVESGLHAGNLAKEIAKIVGGGGGGRADMAQAGGRFPKKVDEAFAFAFTFLHNAIKENR
ncbi:MAG: alanine--tRNA ligase [Candidatus Scalindua sp. AMX11]|nr:MAG: alanine--tRNA ligase [Candidatus Scalindua sp.]NOG85061.1 alanine--tRNA ligase [Planctomycetota bacterium]RZV93109.1 MAG: alanine--tRNA ligase [Candidatus Scalindua sp. SCAELEC01]TDE66735.1 MAG: alanine--tRNA ligase [Candidatus Scalindua sp. AMX11]GJQ58046.1 MAG: alanine--tRNA ligase [Candidatus Scalindua sp.]